MRGVFGVLSGDGVTGRGGFVAYSNGATTTRMDCVFARITTVCPVAPSSPVTRRMSR